MLHHAPLHALERRQPGLQLRDRVLLSCVAISATNWNLRRSFHDTHLTCTKTHDTTCWMKPKPSHSPVRAKTRTCIEIKALGNRCGGLSPSFDGNAPRLHPYATYRRSAETPFPSIRDVRCRRSRHVRPARSCFGRVLSSSVEPNLSVAQLCILCNTQAGFLCGRPCTDRCCDAAGMTGAGYAMRQAA